MTRNNCAGLVRIEAGIRKIALRTMGALVMGSVSLLVNIQSAQAAVTAAQIVTGTAAAPTGTPPYNNIGVTDACALNNNSAYTPGNDPCATDLIVRTNDDVIFQLQFVINSADTVTLVSTLPVVNGNPVADWKALPPQCTGAGSGISANGQTLTCIVSTSAPATEALLPAATIRNSVPNGTLVPIPATTASATGGGNINANSNASSTSAPLKISAAPLYDLDMQTGGAEMQYAKGPTGQNGWLLTFPLVVRVPFGGRGLEPLNAAGMTIQNPMSSLTVTGGSSPALAAQVQAAIQASAQLYNPSNNWPSPIAAVACGPNGYPIGTSYNFSGGASRPYSATNWISLADNGTCTATQAGAGATTSIALTAVNWANPKPATRNDSGTTALLPYGAEVVSDRLAYWIPATVFAGITSGTFTIGNTYTSVTGTSTSGQNLVQPNVPDASVGNTTNDHTTFQTPPFGVTPGSFSKTYMDCQVTGCSTLGFSAQHAEDGMASPGQRFMSQLTLSNQSATYLSGATMCDKIDNSKNILSETVAGDDAISTIGYLGLSNPTLVRDTDYTVEFGIGGLGGVGASWANKNDFANATCSDAESAPNGTWYSHISAVPGGAAAITKVRVRLLTSIPPTLVLDANLLLKNTSPSLVAGFDGPAGTVWPTGTKINNWGTYTTDNLTALNSGSTNGYVSGSARYWYLPGANAYDTSGGALPYLGDAINQAYAQARISKAVQGQTSATNPSQVAAGTTVTYVLTPSLSAATSGGSSTSATISDVLPPSVNYVAGSASLAPSLIQSNSPASGYTTLVWTLSNVVPNTTIAPISYQVLVNGTVSNATVVPNLAKISSPADPSADCSTTGLYAGYTSDGTNGATSGTVCPRATGRYLTASNTTGFKAFKQADKVVVGPGEAITYTNSWLAIGNSPGTIDIIDVLPYNGDGVNNAGLNQVARTPATVVHGSVNMLTTTPLYVVGDSSASFFYTTSLPATINRDPAAAANGGTGTPSASWLSCSNNVCPTNATAIRMVSQTQMTDGTTRSFTYAVNAPGEVSNDTISNTFGARGTGLTFMVNSNTASTNVVAGSIAGTVFLDVHNDGNVASAGNSGLGNVQVCLNGYSFGANGVDDNGAGDDVVIAQTCQQTSATAPVGSYLFSNLAKGKYSVTENETLAASPGLANTLSGKVVPGTAGGTLLAGYTTPKRALAGVTTKAAPVNDVISAVVLQLGQVATGYNFAELPPSSLAGIVYVDQAGTGVFTTPTDPTLGNGLVTLTGTDDLGNTVTLYACSTSAGAYNFIAGGAVQVGGTPPTCTTALPANTSFGGLRPGSYVLSLTPPVGTYTNFVGNPGTGVTTAGVSGINTITGISSTPGQTGANFNFGAAALSRVVSGRVYRESVIGNTVDNGNAVDPGFVTQVTLSCTSPTFSTTVTSNADGTYSFAGVPAGASCTITETQPAGYTSAYTLLGTGSSCTSGCAAGSAGNGVISLVVSANGSTGNSFAMQSADTVSATTCTPPGVVTRGTAVTCTMVCTNKGPGTAVNASCQFTALPAGVTSNTCSTPASSASLASGATLRCVASFPMPAGGYSVLGGSGAINDISGGTIPTAGNNGSGVAATVGGALVSVPTLSEYMLALLSLLMAGLATASMLRKQRAGAQ